jgi:arginase family enzyme
VVYFLLVAVPSASVTRRELRTVLSEGPVEETARALRWPLRSAGRLLLLASFACRSSRHRGRGCNGRCRAGRGEFPVVLGGDDTVLRGCLLALRRLGSAGLVILDGHTDFWDLPDGAGELSDSDLWIATGHDHAAGRALLDVVAAMLD